MKTFAKSSKLDNVLYDVRGPVVDEANRMEEQGMVERKAVPGDRRALRVFLTEKGREKQRYVQQVFTETEEIALSGFSEEECRQLHDYLHRIHVNFEREDEKRL